MKKYFSAILIVCMVIGMTQVSFASSLTSKSLMDDEEYAAKIMASEYASYTSPQYVSIEEYIEKYGENNIIKGLNKAEIKNKVEVLKNATTEEIALLKNNISNFNTEPNDVYLSMVDREFLGMEITGVSDLPPDDIKLSFKLKKKENQNETMSVKDTASVLGHDSYTNYDVYWKTYEPNKANDLDIMAYEPESGAYMYKYSLWFENHCMVETDVKFENTRLYCGTQQNNMYTYVAAKSQYRTLDFGLMANPMADKRNSGMYACYNNGIAEDFFVEAWPKVGLVGNSGNPMIIQNKTVKLKLGVGEANQDYRLELYMEMDGECIFYLKLKEDIIDQIYANDPNNYKLTFMTAMTCVGLPSWTYLNSGSYFTNVKMQNSKLYDTNGNAYPFTTMGDHTYFTFVSRPSAIDFNYGNNWEKVNIVYDN